MSADAERSYADYETWKRWDGACTTSERSARYFAAEFDGIALCGRRLLEIGFGNGEFLAWAKGEGAHVAGVELNTAMRDAARRAGYVVIDATIAELAARGDRYDIIVALDVLEHWDADELVANFRAIRALLVDGGTFLSRFPNGQSPFGRAFQNGDLTHKSALSTFKIGQLAAASGLAVVRVSNARRAPVVRGALASLRHWWRERTRQRIERRIARLYGLPRLPLDPNLVAVLRRGEAISSPSVRTTP